MNNQTKHDGDMDDIDRLLDGIPALQEFQNEPISLATVPAAQRVRTFLADAVSAAWVCARVTSYQMPGGAQTHLAFAKLPRGEMLVVVAEAIDGTLTIPFPFAADDADQVRAAMQFVPNGAGGQQSDEVSEYEDEKHCISKILRAFTEISKIIAAADVKHRRKTRLMGQLAHAAEHLTMNLERLMRE